MSRRPPKAPPGAEYAPVPCGAWAWRSQPIVDAWGTRITTVPVEGPGPHLEPGLPEERWIVADLRDPDTALMVLRRVCRDGGPVQAHALVSLLLSGRWSDRQVAELGVICQRTWGPR